MTPELAARQLLHVRRSIADKTPPDEIFAGDQALSLQAIDLALERLEGHPMTPPRSEVLSQLLAETELLYDQERAPVDALRIDALQVAVQLLSVAERPVRRSEEEKKNEDNGTGLTAVEGVSVSVPTPQLSHDEPSVNAQLRQRIARLLRRHGLVMAKESEKLLMMWRAWRDEVTLRNAAERREDILRRGEASPIRVRSKPVPHVFNSTAAVVRELERVYAILDAIAARKAGSASLVAGEASPDTAQERSEKDETVKSGGGTADRRALTQQHEQEIARLTRTPPHEEQT